MTPPGGNAWVVFPKDQHPPPGQSLRNYTARPINFSNSVGSRLKQSFANINRSTPVESINSNAPLIDEEDTKETRSQRRRTALMAGASVGGGALLLGIVLVGGTLLATSGDSGTYTQTMAF
jgi:glycosyltransferase A (GT-A) superfamily protein (DUF2064 family)